MSLSRPSRLPDMEEGNEEALWIITAADELHLEMLNMSLWFARLAADRQTDHMIFPQAFQ